MVKKAEELKLIAKQRIAEDYFSLDLQAESPLTEIKPGQFVQIRVDNSPKTFLRRPISIFDVDYISNTLKLLIKIAGPGTKALSLLNTGDRVSLVYPLGNGFSLPADTDKVLLVGGGIGVAPLYFMGKIIAQSGINFKFVFGYQSDKYIIDYEKYNKLGDLIISTDDGSMGFHGLVSEHPVLHEGDYNRIYCCGPDPMMKSIAGIAKERGIFCELSLENLMACGIGLCLCCVEDTIDGNICSCTDGPVFNIKQLKWQI